MPVVDRAVSRSAAGGQIGSGKRSRQDGKARQKQRHQGHDGREFSPNPAHDGNLAPKFKHKMRRETTIRNNEKPRTSRAYPRRAILRLTGGAGAANIPDMPHSFLIFDFGTNEEAAQQARHRIEGWKQGFRLDKKLQLKFERKEGEAAPAENDGPASKPAKSSKAAKPAPAAKSKAKPAGKSKSAEESSGSAESAASANGSDIRLIVRLDFSDHEKLSHQRWIERIPAEEPFKNANPKILRPGAPDFQATSDLFDSLD